MGSITPSVLSLKAVMVRRLRDLALTPAVHLCLMTVEWREDAEAFEESHHCAETRPVISEAIVLHRKGRSKPVLRPHKQ